MCDSDRAFAPTIRACGGAALSQDDPIRSSTEKDRSRMQRPAMHGCRRGSSAQDDDDDA
jgi:hypothetical protein